MLLTLSLMPVCYILTKLAFHLSVKGSILLDMDISETEWTWWVGFTGIDLIISVHQWPFSSDFWPAFQEIPKKA